MKGLLDFLMEHGLEGIRQLLPGVETVGENAYRLSVSDETVNALLPLALDEEEVTVTFGPGKLLIKGSKQVLGSSVEVAATLALIDWELDVEKALFVFEPDGPIEKKARGMVGKAILLTLTGLWGSVRDRGV
jgi:hypothetical protein